MRFFKSQNNRKSNLIKKYLFGNQVSATFFYIEAPFGPQTPPAPYAGGTRTIVLDLYCWLLLAAQAKAVFLLRYRLAGHSLCPCTPTVKNYIINAP
jgi:hypothetical protein